MDERLKEKFGEKFTRALAAFDAANDTDPVQVEIDGKPVGRELFYSRKLYEWVIRLDPEASEALLLAARCQHLRRFAMPRTQYPAGKVGYLQWRVDQAKKHAREAGEILGDCGYSESTVEKVQKINRKQGIKTDPEVQTMEDALCLVFLEHQFEDFSREQSEEKVVDIVRKTWGKMGLKGREAALRLNYSERALGLIQKALAAETG